MYKDNAMEKDDKFVQINGKRYSQEELKKMSVSELTNIINDIQIEINNVTLRLKENNCKSKSQLSKVKIYLQNSMLLASKIRKQVKVKYNNDFNSLFVRKAREFLDDATFMRIEESVKDTAPIYC